MMVGALLVRSRHGIPSHFLSLFGEPEFCEHCGAKTSDCKYRCEGAIEEDIQVFHDIK